MASLLMAFLVRRGDGSKLLRASHLDSSVAAMRTRLCVLVAPPILPNLPELVCAWLWCEGRWFLVATPERSSCWTSSGSCNESGTLSTASPMSPVSVHESSDSESVKVESIDSRRPVSRKPRDMCR